MEIERRHDGRKRGGRGLVATDLQAVDVVAEVVGMMDGPAREPEHLAFQLAQDREIVCADIRRSGHCSLSGNTAAPATSPPRRMQPSSTTARERVCRPDDTGGLMPEADTEGQRFAAATPQATPGFFLKGSHQLDWGMKNRLARVFDPNTGRTVMLAVDHGYFQGPTTGLERIDLSIVPLLPSCDALFCTRGILRSVIPAESAKPMVLRASGGPSILKELSDEQIAMDMEDALRLNAAGVGIQVFIGGEHETRSIHNMTKLVDAGLRYGMPVMGVTAVGTNMVRDAKYFRLACRIIAELGAQYVKTYYVPEDFETVTASCPVPIVMAGGKKLPELDALTMAYNAVQQGAAGVDMGRNIFQSDAPQAMIAAINAVVHKNAKPKEALELFTTLKRRAASVSEVVRMANTE